MKLSSAHYWNSLYQNTILPRVNSPDTYSYSITMEFVDCVLQDENKKTFLEIGCGASGWLPYFAKKYGLLVSGIDYSERGCKLAEENLKMLKIPYDEIICADIFAWQSSKKYDIIFSYGVLEHFDNPEAIVRIACSHLNKNGIIISLVPNLVGIIGATSKFVVPEIFRMHKVMSIRHFQTIHETNGFRNIKTDFAGIFSIGVIPWEKSKHWLFKKSRLQGIVCFKLIGIINLLLSNIFKKIKYKWSSRLFSPYMICVMRKEDGL